MVVMVLPKFALDAQILENKSICQDIWQMTVACPEIARQAQPGMFVHIGIPRGELLLRRPISMADVDAAAGTLLFIYRRVGKGTHCLSELAAGDSINCLGPLGHGFDLTAKKPLLVGGGMGIAPLLFLAKKMKGGADILMGGRNEQEMFWPSFYREYVRNIFITTDDGSLGSRGVTSDLLPQLLISNAYDRIVVCGPEVMMRSIAHLAQQYGIPCQLSLEKRMACGLGACLSCSCDTNSGQRKKVCKDGPVFWAQEVL